MMHLNGQTWWDSLRHIGLLLGPPQVREIEGAFPPPALSEAALVRLRRNINRFEGGDLSPADFVFHCLVDVFGFATRGVGIGSGTWYRGNHVDPAYAHLLVTGESMKPQLLWKGVRGGILPVFLDDDVRLGVGRGRKTVTDVVQWLRQARSPLAVLSNARQWRLIHAGLDYDAQAESDLDVWFEEGAPAPQLAGLRQLLQPALLDGSRGREQPTGNREQADGQESSHSSAQSRPDTDSPFPVPSSPLAELIARSRRGHAELSALLGERVREAVEELVRSHGEALKQAGLQAEGAAIYRAAVRVVMRMVVVLFAESRDLLPRSNPVYESAYGLQGLFEQLQRQAVRARGRLAHRFSAWPRVLSLFRLICEGSHHADLAIPAYGGELFAPGDPASTDAASRAIHVFETACFDSARSTMPDSVTFRVLELLTRTRMRIRQGRGSTTTVVPVDFRDLSSEYIGILYEGLLDHELRTAPADDAIVFLGIGNEPALPLSRLETMEERQIRDLLEGMKDSDDRDEGEDEETADAESPADDAEDEADGDVDADDEAGAEGDNDVRAADAAEPLPVREELQARALNWTRRVCAVAGLVSRPRGRQTPESDMVHRQRLDAKARQLVRRLVLPGEWYLVRWGGTRKGSGTFYTRPQLAVPTVQRTLRPLCYRSAADASGGLGTPSPTPLPGNLDSPDPTSLDSRTPQDAGAPANSANPVADASRREPGPAPAPAPVVDGPCASTAAAGDGGATATAALPPSPDVPAVACLPEGSGETRRPGGGPGAEPPSASALRAPGSVLIPRKPEEILALKVCDPACGSGSFLVATVRYLTDALFASLYAHGRLKGDVDRTLVYLLGLRTEAGEVRLVDEHIPCRPNHELFELRLKAILRRHVVERCIYGVDLDPLGTELCRLALWIETMDRDLPFSFLDHKIKCGNSLIGAWFDTFAHYPAMAWKRDGGDSAHANGVHWAKEERNKAIKAFMQETVVPDLVHTISVGRRSLFLYAGLDGHPKSPAELHAEAYRALQAIHDLPVHDTPERARQYRALVGSDAWKRLKRAFDAWCALWFWPADEFDAAPLPSNLGDLPPATGEVVDRLAARKRFFHWEIEFPDVFSPAQGDPELGVQASTAASPVPCSPFPVPSFSGFDAILGNPPWNVAKPKSKEFFSNIDPLYRAYGKQEALRFQTAYFADPSIEEAWLDHGADLKAQSHFVKCARNPWGDPCRSEDGDERFALARGRQNDQLHALWRSLRAGGQCYADPAHPYQHQGSADVNLYKLFLEQAHALLRPGGRLGLIVPSGVYSDHGTRDLRALLLDHCRWEWLFGFENREGIFDIHRSFKFNPVIIRKGGQTEAIRTAFMRRRLSDWETAEAFVTDYSRAQIRGFSPKSLAILEIRSRRDLEVLSRIYENSVLLGDDGPDGWGIRYAREFDMTNDSRLFPPRPVWEAWGYRPDEYSRWIKGPWKPISELWQQLGVETGNREQGTAGREQGTGPGQREEDSGQQAPDSPTSISGAPAASPSPVPSSPFPAPPASGPVPGDRQRLRVAQPPYDTLPIPRADIPAGIILSRDADAWIREDQIPVVTFTDASGKPLTIREGRGKNAVEREISGPAIALPLYQGVMVNQLALNTKSHISGTGFTAVWEEIDLARRTAVSPQYLVGVATYSASGYQCRVAYRRIARTTDSRTWIGCLLPHLPCGDSVFLLIPRSPGDAIRLGSSLSTFWYDWTIRQRLGGTNLSWFVVSETAAVPEAGMPTEAIELSGLACHGPVLQLAPEWLRFQDGRRSWGRNLASTLAERTRLEAILHALTGATMGLTWQDACHVLRGCDHVSAAMALGAMAFDSRGFWRVDKDKPPEQRLTVLSLVAFHDLQAKIDACGGDVQKGIEAFCTQNDGEGWLLPETLRLADYGLGHDERALHPQPVRSCFGPRFYDWQLAQSPEESWRECHLHARNLLGEAAYEKLLEELESGTQDGERGTGPLTQLRASGNRGQGAGPSARLRIAGKGEPETAGDASTGPQERSPDSAQDPRELGTAGPPIAYPEAGNEDVPLAAEAPIERDLFGNPIVVERDLFGNVVPPPRKGRRR